MQPQDPIKRRIFVVGVARSGTTLIQSMIGSHPEIHAFPESHFWDKTLYKQKALQRFQIINTSKLYHLQDFLDAIHFKENLNWPDKIYSKKKLTGLFLKLLDKVALENRKLSWVEKTPLNLYYISLIKRACIDCYFVHMIRNGTDNIASLYEASVNNPGYFSQNTIDSCINRYKKEINISRSYIGKKNHFFIRYETLVENPEPTLKNLCRFLKTEYSNAMLNYQETATSVTGKEEKWKKNNTGLLKKTDKKNIVFSPSQVEYINKAINSVNLDVF